MTQLISALSEISRDYRAVFCDLWGCLHNGKTVFPRLSLHCRNSGPKAGPWCC